MKKRLLLLVSILAFACSSQAQVMNCGSFCVLNINNVDTTNNTLDVTIFNGDTNQVNYPIVVVTNSLGDTVANITNSFYLFAQLAGDTVAHTIPTTLDSIPTGFTGTVYFTDPVWGNTCSYAYPMSCTVGINEQYAANNSLLIYPNPASTEITIYLGTTNAKSEVSVFDATGKKVRSINTNSESLLITRENLPSGIYFVTVLQNGKQRSKKIVFE